MQYILHFVVGEPIRRQSCGACPVHDSMLFKLHPSAASNILLVCREEYDVAVTFQERVMEHLVEGLPLTEG